MIKTSPSLEQIQFVKDIADVPTDKQALEIYSLISGEGELTEDLVLEADFLRQYQSCMVMESITKTVSNEIKVEPKHTNPKLKVAKGLRYEVPCPVTGKNYGFGPVWNQKVIDATGDAVDPKHRPKLNHQARMYGIENPENYEAEALCELVADFISKD